MTQVSLSNSIVKTIENHTKDMQEYTGFFDFYWDNNSGKVFLKIEHLDHEFLYTNYLQSGVGSNDIGLDRGQIGDSRLVKFKRFGHKILLIEPNLDYRAISDNVMEQKAVEDGFAQSVIWGGVIEAEFENEVLVDITDFLLRDSHDISNRLKRTKQGNYKIDKNLSVVFMQNTKSFANNTEFEALITLSGNQGGSHVLSVTPSAHHISVRTHHSFVKLPEKPYKTRKFDARAGAISMSFDDYAAPLGQDITKKFIIRHRLEKKYPNQPVSDPVKPIIYYLDPGTPEPIKSALIDGAMWWSQGFEAAGFSNAFKVELLPETADPLDIRYNTIQWVHRSTRGWSYGASIIDPRTGEILKGHVTLGSLRVRQDMLIAKGLLSPYKADINVDDRIQQMALARIRQLSAHEVGHTLGLSHNFSASANNRASVMDYPHPLVSLTKDNKIDLSDAYSTQMGDWDKVSLSYIYSEFSEPNESKLSQILIDAKQRGLVFISDSDARAQAGSHPSAHLWDNATDPIQGLYDVLQVRNVAMENFGLDTLKNGQELFKLEQILTPIYLFHRYQVQAVTKLIAGVDYQYAIKGDADPQSTIVIGEVQHKAIKALIKTLQAEQLALPENILELLLPPPDGSSRNREHFQSKTGLNFDALGAAKIAAQHTLKYLLNPQRANRLLEQNARLNSVPSVSELLQILIENTWYKKTKNRYFHTVQNSINSAVLDEIINLASSQESSDLTKAQVFDELQKLKLWLKKKNTPLAKFSYQKITTFMNNPTQMKPTRSMPIPPGSPIGM